jgi:hypothetical protein
VSVLDSYTVESSRGRVTLTLTAVFGDATEYWIPAEDAAMIGAVLLVHAANAHEVTP